MNRRPNFRPNAQNLESRRLMAADVAAEADEPAGVTDGTSNSLAIGEARTRVSSHASVDRVFTEMGRVDDNSTRFVNGT